jgi:hypothetical protein
LCQDARAVGAVVTLTKNTGTRLALVAAFLLYASVVIATATRHEVWRDETQTLGYAIHATSMLDLLRGLGTEGHPGLWYVHLRVVHTLYPHPEALKIASILVALATVALVLWRSPFALPVRLLLPFGIFPLYEYSVICRNYGMAALLTFVFVSMYEARGRRFALVGLVLFLLAQTHVIAIVVVLAIAASLAYEQWRGIPEAIPAAVWQRAAGWSLILFGVVLGALTAYPTQPFHGARFEELDAPGLALSLLL